MIKFHKGGHPVPDDGIKIDDPNIALTKIEKGYIILDELGLENTIHFLKHANTITTIYSNKRLPKKLKPFIDEEVSSDKKPSIFQIVSYIQRPNLTWDEKMNLLKENKTAPRIVLKLLIKQTPRPVVAHRLAMLDAAGEPTYEGILQCVEK